MSYKESKAGREISIQYSHNPPTSSSSSALVIEVIVGGQKKEKQNTKDGIWFPASSKSQSNFPHGLPYLIPQWIQLHQRVGQQVEWWCCYLWSSVMNWWDVRCQDEHWHTLFQILSHPPSRGLSSAWLLFFLLSFLVFSRCLWTVLACDGTSFFHGLITERDKRKWVACSKRPTVSETLFYWVSYVKHTVDFVFLLNNGF